MLSCDFFSSTSKVLSFVPAIVELFDRLTFLELALYLDPSLVLVLSVELELESEDSEIERDGCLGFSLMVKASFSSVPTSSSFSWTLLEHLRVFLIFALGTLSL